MSKDTGLIDPFFICEKLKGEKEKLKQKQCDHIFPSSNQEKICMCALQYKNNIMNQRTVNRNLV